MDEIENVKIMKKLMKIFVILLLLIVLFVKVKMLTEIIFLNAILNFLIMLMLQIEFLVIILLVPKIINVCTSKIRYLVNSKKYISKNKEYVRDIELKYSLVIISLILDLQISYYKDYTATILYLCYRKSQNIKRKM